MVFELKCSNTTSTTDAVLGPDFLGTISRSNLLLPRTQNRGLLSDKIYLFDKQVVSIRFQQNNTALQLTNTTNGTINFTVVELL